MIDIIRVLEERGEMRVQKNNILRKWKLKNSKSYEKYKPTNSKKLTNPKQDSPKKTTRRQITVKFLQTKCESHKSKVTENDKSRYKKKKYYIERNKDKKDY